MALGEREALLEETDLIPDVALGDKVPLNELGSTLLAVVVLMGESLLGVVGLAPHPTLPV